MDDAAQRLTGFVLGGPRPLQRRLTFLTMLAVGLTVAVTCLSGWLALRTTLFDISERGSSSIAQDLVPRAIEDLGRTGRLGSRVLGAGTTVVAAVRADGTVLTAPGEDVSLALGRPEVAAAQERQQIVRNTTSSSGEAYRIVTVPLDDTGAVLVVGRPLTSSYEVLHVFGLVVLIVGSVGVFWAWLLGRAVSRKALQPVRRFTEAVQHVAETEDLQPLPASYGSGDLETLRRTFNQMLRSLATSRDQQHRLVADAGHELRTPLTSVRTNLELLSMDEHRRRLSGDQRTSMLADALAQSVELSTLISELVHLARENGSSVRDPLDVGDVAEAAVERAGRRHDGVEFRTDLGSLTLLGDASSLEHALTHLLDNAVAWSPPGGTVHVRLRGQRLEIADEGPGIADDDLPHVFDRFYRSEGARSTTGHGLGLSIATKAFEEHGGTLTVGRAPEGGALFAVDLPGLAHPDPSAAPAPVTSVRVLYDRTA